MDDIPTHKEALEADVERWRACWRQAEQQIAHLEAERDRLLQALTAMAGWSCDECDVARWALLAPHEQLRGSVCAACGQWFTHDHVCTAHTLTTTGEPPA